MSPNSLAALVIAPLTIKMLFPILTKILIVISSLIPSSGSLRHSPLWSLHYIFLPDTLSEEWKLRTHLLAALCHILRCRRCYLPEQNSQETFLSRIFITTIIICITSTISDVIKIIVGVKLCCVIYSKFNNFSLNNYNKFYIPIFYLF